MKRIDQDIRGVKPSVRDGEDGGFFARHPAGSAMVDHIPDGEKIWGRTGVARQMYLVEQLVWAVLFIDDVFYPLGNPDEETSR